MTPTSAPPAMPKIAIQDVRKSFTTAKGALPVVGGVSLDVRDGEFVAIVGPSGCGKSTLMNMIAGMIIIGLIGLLLDGLMRLLEGLKVVRWRYAH
jgi:NitT/TauT family transport system ATP-binding protein/sulfonate transport system ATP-binding protein